MRLGLARRGSPCDGSEAPQAPKPSNRSPEWRAIPLFPFRLSTVRKDTSPSPLRV